MKSTYKVACIFSLSISVIAFIICRAYDIELVEPFVWGGIVIGAILVCLNSLKSLNHRQIFH